MVILYRLGVAKENPVLQIKAQKLRTAVLFLSKILPMENQLVLVSS